MLDRKRWQGRVFIGGTWEQPSGGTIEVREPATGELLARAGAASAADVRRAGEHAAEAQPDWARTPGAARAAVMRTAGLLLERQSGEIARWIMRETGSVRRKAQFEIEASFSEFMEAAALATQSQGELLAPTEAGQTNLARRLPIGVVGAITPWNSPLILAMRVLGPALALGNAVVLKPDPQTPVSGGVIVARLLEEAGLPAGVLQVLPGGADVGEAIVTDERIEMVSFTGSTEAGRRVGALAGARLKKVSLELGGNNAIIVLDDADLEAASSAASFGAFFHQGQICMTAGCHLVAEGIAERYGELLAARAGRLAVGDPNTADVAIGPMINDAQVERVDRIVHETVAAGATVLAGATHDGLFYRPTVLDAVTESMPAFAEEIFGPVAPISVFASDDDAIRLANRTAYGLVASVQTTSLSRGLAVAERLRTGIVHINDQTIADVANAPFGGMGHSGNGGRFGSPSNREEFTQWQWLTFREQQKTYTF
ncbi:MAG: benzaldehyde dehydrogenase [Solirubrobacteraceae bacterium]